MPTDAILREIRSTVNSSQHIKPQPAYTKNERTHTHTRARDAITAHKTVGLHTIWDGTESLKDTKDGTKIDAIAPTFHMCLIYNTVVLSVLNFNRFLHIFMTQELQRC